MQKRLAGVSLLCSSVTVERLAMNTVRSALQAWALESESCFKSLHIRPALSDGSGQLPHTLLGSGG